MDELVVTGCICKFVDHVLINQNPFRSADFFADLSREFRWGNSGHGCLSCKLFDRTVAVSNVQYKPRRFAVTASLRPSNPASANQALGAGAGGA
jgi:hypothetical protein